VAHLFSGTRWRLGGINATQAKAVAKEPAPAAAHHDFDDFDRQLYLTLQYDGRLGLRDLAAKVDRSPAAVRNRLDILTRSRLLTFRTDFARPAAGWPTNVVLKLRVGETAAVSRVGRALVHWPETRVCADLIGGAANLFVTAQLHDLATLDELTARLDTEFPGVTVIDQRVLLRAVKSFGRRLGADGRAHDVVPVDLWAPTA
jgi:DNA-binding Lrp family transcriptional regulator